MDERADNGTEPPPPIAAALAAADVFVAPTSQVALAHPRPQGRVATPGARGATMPGRHDRHARARDGGGLRGAAGAQRARSRARSSERRARRTSPARAAPTCGSTCAGATGIADDGDLTAPGAFGNLPCGEGFIAPAGGEGTVVASSLAAIGLAAEPARLTVRDGRLVGGDRSGGRAAARSAARPRRRRARTSPSSASARTTARR